MACGAGGAAPLPMETSKGTTTLVKSGKASDSDTQIMTQPVLSQVLFTREKENRIPT